MTKYDKHLQELIRCRKELEAILKDLENMQNEVDNNLKMTLKIRNALKTIKQDMMFINAELVGIRCEAEDALQIFEDIQQDFRHFKSDLDTFTTNETKKLEEDLKVKLAQKLAEEAKQKLLEEKKVAKKHKLKRRNEEIEKKTKKLQNDEVKNEDIIKEEILEQKKVVKKRKLERNKISFTSKVDDNDQVAQELLSMKQSSSNNVGGWQRS